MENQATTELQTTDLKDVLRNRRSIRHYKKTAVPRVMIEEVVNAGRLAPSAMNRQPWNFYIVTDEEMIARMSKAILKASVFDFAKSGVRHMLKTASDLYHAVRDAGFKSTNDPVFHGAPVVVFLTAPPEDEWALIDIGMCAQNMLLRAHDLGLAACPVGFAKLIEHTKEYGSLRIPDSEHVVLSVVLGFSEESPVAHPMRKNNVFYLQE